MTSASGAQVATEQASAAAAPEATSETVQSLAVKVNSMLDDLGRETREKANWAAANKLANTQKANLEKLGPGSADHPSALSLTQRTAANRNEEVGAYYQRSKEHFNKRTGAVDAILSEASQLVRQMISGETEPVKEELFSLRTEVSRMSNEPRFQQIDGQLQVLTGLCRGQTKS